MEPHDHQHLVAVWQPGSGIAVHNVKCWVFHLFVCLFHNPRLVIIVAQYTRQAMRQPLLVLFPFAGGGGGAGLGTLKARFVAWPLELGLGTRNPRFVVWPLELRLGTRNPRFVAWPLELGLGTRNPRFVAWPLELAPPVGV